MENKNPINANCCIAYQIRSVSRKKNFLHRRAEAREEREADLTRMKAFCRRTGREKEAKAFR